MLINRVIQPLQDLRLSAVVFDLDGTLCHYGISIERAMADALRQVGVPPDLIGDLSLAADRYYDLWYDLQDVDSTLSLRERIWLSLLSEHGTNDPALARRIAQVYIAARTKSLVLFDGVLPLLSDLREKYSLGLLTNGPSEMQWEKIDLLGLKGCFDTITVSGDAGIHKPDTRVFSGLLERLNTAAGRAVYVGNSYEMDIIGASETGMFSVWVNPDGEEEPQDHVADAIITDVTELRGLLL